MRSDRQFQLISPPEADKRLQLPLGHFGQRRVALSKAAGEVLAGEILADRDFPPFDRVAMDGIAVAWQETITSWSIKGMQAAGTPRGKLAAGSAMEAMTGAMLPDGADTVIPVEHLLLAKGRATLADGQTVRRGQNVHHQATDRRAGDVVLKAGTLLDGPALAVAASVGAIELSVIRRPRIRLISTGSELVDPSQQPREHQIRASNLVGMRHSLELHGFPVDAARIVEDDPATILAAISAALEEADVLILSGGVSMGDLDHVPDLLDEAGLETLFHGIAQRPGKPLLAARGSGKLVFALPGNPVSALVCLHRYVLKCLRQAIGFKEVVTQACLSTDYQFSKELAFFLPVILETQADGRLTASPAETGGSGDLAGLAGTDGFLELAADRDTWQAGESLPLTRWLP
jgi:molybdopterin molybdotransferase